MQHLLNDIGIHNKSCKHVAKDSALAQQCEVNRENLGNEIISYCKEKEQFKQQMDLAVAGQNPIVPDLANDPNAARLSATQLRLVDGRIANLQKAIALLGDSNPEWARERKRVLEAMHEDAVGITWEGVNILTIGLTQLGERIALSHLSDMHINALVKAFKEQLTNLPSEEGRLNRIMATTQDPSLTKAILEYTSTLHRLRDAQYSNDVAIMVRCTRDAAETLKSEFEVLKLKPQPADINDGLYVSSAFVGAAAIIFVSEGPEAVAASVGSAMSSIAVGGRELVNLWQEWGRMAALGQNTSDRNRVRVQLIGRLNELQEQHDRLVWAVQRAGPAN
jgi:ubiquinone biosynthesis protein UbiJ